MNTWKGMRTLVRPVGITAHQGQEQGQACGVCVHFETCRRPTVKNVKAETDHCENRTLGFARRAA